METLTEVFFCTAIHPNDKIRFGLALACFERWQEEPGIRLTVVCCTRGRWFPEFVKAPLITADVSPQDFDEWRRMTIPELARGGNFLICDDDCMPIGTDFVKRGVSVLRAHPDYRCICAGSLTDQFDSLSDTNTWGWGMAFMRKGEGKTGATNDIRFNHLGYKQSTWWCAADGITKVFN